MRGLRQAVGAFACVVSLLAATAGHTAEPEQFFASVFLDKKKIGQFPRAGKSGANRRDRGTPGARLGDDARRPSVRVHP